MELDTSDKRAFTRPKDQTYNEYKVYFIDARRETAALLRNNRVELRFKTCVEKSKMATMIPFSIYSVVRGGMFDSDFYFVDIQDPVNLSSFQTSHH